MGVEGELRIFIVIWMLVYAEFLTSKKTTLNSAVQDVSNYKHSGHGGMI